MGKAMTKEQFIKNAESQYGNGVYTLLSSFINMSTRIKIRHNVCGYEWSIIPSNVVGYKSPPCPRCSKREAYTTESYSQKIKTESNSKAELIGEFICTKKKVEIYYKDCGHSHTTIPRLVKPYCPICSVDRNLSNGEKIIRDFLNKKKINFKVQYSFNDCKNVNKLLFDFALFDSNGKLMSLIEFDGIQHFESIEWFGGERNLKSQQIKDNIKNTYCAGNKIKLIRIPYWDEENIEKILEDKLSKEIATNTLFMLNLVSNTKVKKTDLNRYLKLDQDYLMQLYPEVYEVLYV